MEMGPPNGPPWGPSGHPPGSAPRRTPPGTPENPPPEIRGGPGGPGGARFWTPPGGPWDGLGGTLDCMVVGRVPSQIDDFRAPPGGVPPIPPGYPPDPPKTRKNTRTKHLSRLGELLNTKKNVHFFRPRAGGGGLAGPQPPAPGGLPVAGPPQGPPWDPPWDPPSGTPPSGGTPSDAPGRTPLATEGGKHSRIERPRNSTG